MVHKIWQPFPKIEKNLCQVKQMMKSSIYVPMPEVQNKIIEYIDAPGKFIRSGLTLTIADGLNVVLDEELLKAAASIELLHLATLIHDDVIDNASTRRGVEAMHIHFSNRIAIYAGDYLLSLSGRLAEEAHLSMHTNWTDKKILEKILIGELRQLMNQYRLNMNMFDYLRQIQGKTAVLFGMATLVAGIKAGLSKRTLKRLYYAGQMMGMAFQLNDDLIDYRQIEMQSGKPQFQDIQNGIYTAPFILLNEQTEIDLSNMNFECLHQQLLDRNIYRQVEMMRDKYLQKSENYLRLINIDTTSINHLFKFLVV